MLSPYQARRVRAPGGEWRDATGARFDPTRPYRVRVGARELVVFFYDGHIARDLAFGDALSSPEALIRRLEGGFDAGRGHDELLTVALDGETLGHHKKGGDEVLAAALRLLARRDDLELVNLGQALDRVAQVGGRDRGGVVVELRARHRALAVRLRLQRQGAARMDAGVACAPPRRAGGAADGARGRVRARVRGPPHRSVGSARPLRGGVARARPARRGGDPAPGGRGGRSRRTRS